MPSNDQLSLREIELHLSQRPSSRRYLRHGSRNHPALFDGLHGPNASIGGIAGKATSGRQGFGTGNHRASAAMRSSQQTQRNAHQPYLLSQRYGPSAAGSKYPGEQRSFREVRRPREAHSSSFMQKAMTNPAAATSHGARGSQPRGSDLSKSIIVEVHESYQTMPQTTLEKHRAG